MAFRFAEKRALWLAIGLSCAVFVAHALWLRATFAGNACDDAYISFRYLDMLRRGHGLVYNPGEIVEGYSNLLWMILLMPAAFARADLATSSQVLGIFFGIGTIAVCIHALRSVIRVRSAWALLATGVLVGASGYFAAWSVSGLESSLHAFLLVTGWARYHVESGRSSKLPIAGLCFGLLAPTRPEGLILAGVALAYHLGRAMTQRARPATWPFLVGLLVPIALFEAFRLSTYGLHLWPNSVRAKVAATFPVYVRGARYVAEKFLDPYAPMLIPVLAVPVWMRRDAALCTGALLLAGCLVFIVGVGGDWSHGRFFAPLVPLASVLAVGALAKALAAVPRRRSALARGVAAVAFLAFTVYAFRRTTIEREYVFLHNYAAWDSRRIRLGKWFAKHAPPNARVGLLAAGQIAYFSNGMRMHDMLGLNDAYIASLDKRMGDSGLLPGHEKFDLDYTLKVVRPEFISDAKYMPGMMRHPAFRNYAPLPGHFDVHVLKSLLPRYQRNAKDGAARR